MFPQSLITRPTNIVRFLFITSCLTVTVILVLLFLPFKLTCGPVTVTINHLLVDEAETRQGSRYLNVVPTSESSAIRYK